MAFLNLQQWRTFWLTIGLLLTLPNVFAATTDQIKVVFTYNFTKYVLWPDDAFQTETAPFNLCLDTNADFQKLMRLTVQNEQVYGRTFDIIDIHDHQNMPECHLLFVGQGNQNTLADYQRIYSQNTLIVSDLVKSIYQGSMIELRYENGRFNIYINRKQSLAAGLKILSTLLNLAVIVDE